MVKKRGIVWNFFTKKVHGSQITAFCKFCDQSYIQNATRMEKHIERCIKCPEDVKQEFMRAVRNKRARSILTMKLADDWSAQQSQTAQNNLHEQNLTSLKDWEYRNEINNPIQDNNATNDSDIIDSKSWNGNSQQESGQPEVTSNREWGERIERSREEAEEFATSEIQEVAEAATYTRRIHPKRFSQLPLLSGRTSVSSIWQNKTLQEQYLERRALRRIAELDLQRKTLEYERFQWEYQKEKTQSEVRWAHECRMMQLKEEEQRRLIEKTCNSLIASQSNVKI